MNREQHWNHVYQTKAPDDVSWFQTRPANSLRLIAACDGGKIDGIIDIGGGASALVDFLLDAGCTNLAVLDIAVAALDHARRRLGDRASAIEWFAADVTRFTPSRRFALWHDRAVFHFLTEKADRQQYVATMRRTLSLEGHAIIATFASDGPDKCSGLDVRLYDAPTISAELGAEFQLLEQQN